MVLFDAMSRRLGELTEDVELLRRAVAPRLVSRKEAARIAGCTPRTIRRWEDRGLLRRAPTKTGGILYEYGDVVALKRMFK